MQTLVSKFKLVCNVALNLECPSLYCCKSCYFDDCGLDLLSSLKLEARFWLCLNFGEEGFVTLKLSKHDRIIRI